MTTMVLIAVVVMGVITVGALLVMRNHGRLLKDEINSLRDCSEKNACTIREIIDGLSQSGDLVSMSVQSGNGWVLLCGADWGGNRKTQATIRRIIDVLTTHGLARDKQIKRWDIKTELAPTNLPITQVVQLLMDKVGVTAERVAAKPETVKLVPRTQKEGK